jgi:glucose/arabinose dehydrogenase/uncharacterized cupredoxin-like copper-binding protein
MSINRFCWLVLGLLAFCGLALARSPAALPMALAQAQSTPRPTVLLPTVTPDLTLTAAAQPATPTATRGGGSQREPASATGAQPLATSPAIHIAADPTLLRFTPLTVTVRAGQPFSLTFANPAAMLHNWVLVPEGQEERVDRLALARNGDARNLPSVIAATALISETISTLTLPPLPAGRYRYLCTVPGHFQAGMWGTLLVTTGATPPAPRPSPLAPRPTATSVPTATAATGQTQRLPLALVEVGRELARPVFVTHAGDQSGRRFVVEKAGTIRTLPDNELFLDITDRVGSGASEQGLLGLAFHPRFAANGHFYVNYTDKGGDTVIARFGITARGAGDARSETVLLTATQPASNHNGGMLAFGPDGYLYIGLGDGGGSRDRYGNAQNLTTFLGKILRIDVDSAEPYAIPPDNPLSDGEEARPEIWAYGLRNPWRFSFDRRTGDLYIGDVGQNRFEWLIYQPAASPGGENYGWPILEGQSCLNGDDCDRTGLTEAIYSYPHSQGCAITGGYVYRGAQFPALQGVYVFGDYCSGRIWTMQRAADGAWVVSEALDSDASLSSFGEDEAGELYAVDYSKGAVYQVVVQ